MDPNANPLNQPPANLAASAPPGIDVQLVAPIPAPDIVQPPAGADPLAQPPQGEPEASRVPEAPPPKVHQLHESEFKRLKDEQREKGRKAALTELDQRARALGYPNWAALEKAAADAKQRPTLPKPQAAKPAAEASPEASQGQGSGNQEADELTRLRAEAAQLRERERKARIQLQRQQKAQAESERVTAAREAEHELSIAAAKAGVKDTKYALHLLREHLSGKSVEELNSFDESKFFSSELRKTHPYLYEVESRAPTTGPGADLASPSPKSPPAAPPTGNPNDVRKMSQQEFEAYLRSKGMTPPLAGLPL